MDYFKSINFTTSYSTGQKRRFLFYGFINFLVTNVILQLLLLIIPVSISTFISQLVNMSIGLFLYGKKVFRKGKIDQVTALKYLILASLLWILNWTAINFLFDIGYSRNLSALIILPALVALSYFCQKLLVFK